MNQLEPALTTPKKGIVSVAQYLFMGTGFYALACAPAILFAEQLGWSQFLLNLSQLVTTILCVLSATCFLWITQGLGFIGIRCFAVVACVFSSLWLSFVVYVLLNLDFGGID